MRKLLKEIYGGLMFRTGCLFFVGLVLIFAAFEAQPQTAWIAGFIGVGIIGATIFGYFANRRREQQELTDSLTSQAIGLERLAADGFSPEATFALEPGEKLIYKDSHIELAAIAGELKPLDQGSAFYTTQRVIFTGAAQTMVWPLASILQFEPGPNGQWVTIATLDGGQNFALKQVNQLAPAPGILFDIAMTSYNDGEAAGIDKTREYAQSIRAAVAAAPKR